MKKIYQIIILLLLSVQGAFLGYGQIYYGDVDLTTQVEVDSFGALGYTKVTGILSIDGTNIIDLSSLSTLTYIGDSLSHNSSGISISYTNLTNLIGLHNVDTVAGQVVVYNNHSLTSINLNKLSIIEFYFDLTNNDNLQNLSGLDSLKVIKGIYNIFKNNNLTTLNGLQNLMYIKNFNHLQYPSSLPYRGDLRIILNLNLIDYCALNNLIANDGIEDNYNVVDNLYNPTLQDLQNNICTDCSNNVNISISSLGSQVIANQTGASYQWLDCDNNYAVIPNETSNVYSSLTYGNFAVQIIYNGCVDTSACVTINALDFQEVYCSISITLSPNPTTGNINLDFGLIENKNVRVINRLGQVIYEENNISDFAYCFNLDASEGIYIVEVFSDDFRKQFKVVKL